MDYRRRPELAHVKMEWQGGVPPRSGYSTKNSFATNLANQRFSSNTQV